MESSDNSESSSTATSASPVLPATRVHASAEQLAEQASALEAVVARYERLLGEEETASRGWERIFDAIEDPICVVTAEYELVYANAAYTSLFGTSYELGGRHYCFALASTGESAQDGRQSRGGPCADCPLPETVRTRHAGFTQQVWRQPHGSDGPDGPDGAPRTRTYQRWTYPVVNADGAVDRVVEVLKDVTEQERMRRSAARTAALREADRLKAELLGTVSHELRSPLTAIKGYAATLLRHERRLPREERRAFLEAIGEASNRLEVIINRLLEMSQLETGSIVPHRAPVDVAQVAREAIAFAEQQAWAHEPGRHTFSLRLLGRYGTYGTSSGTMAVDVPVAMPVIDADARLLRDALDNLLENAVKYSPDGGNIEVTLGMYSPGGSPGGLDRALAATGAAGGAAAMAGEAEGGAEVQSPVLLEVIVRDAGVGIPAEHLGRVFERFHRVDTRLTRAVDGLGLGLAMCKRIAELHGGAIWAESAPGAGSAFHLVLPAAAATAQDEVIMSTARESEKE